MLQQQEYDINSLFQEAQTRWLKPAEVLYILQNHEKYSITQEAPNRPTSGSVFLFNKRVLRFFRKDGHNWRKKRDGRTVGEAHERLKVGNAEALNCYYAHGEDNPNFQRRSYWMLDPECMDDNIVVMLMFAFADRAYEHIVLVHYRDISEGRTSAGSATHLSPVSHSTFSQSPSSYNTQNRGSTSAVSDYYDPYQPSSSPASVEVSSEMTVKGNGESTADVASTANDEVNWYLRRLEEQLSLNEDSIKEIDPVYCPDESANDVELLDYGRKIYKENQSSNDLHEQKYIVDATGYEAQPGMQQTNNIMVLQDPGLLLPHEEKFDVPAYSPVLDTQTNSDYYAMLYDQDQLGMPVELGPSLTVSQQQKFTINEISPEWGYATEATKVIIVGSFLCDPLESAWTCMFGDIEVPLQIIQNGVIRCEAPPHLPGKVTLCITSGNRESCSQIREFEYRAKDSSCARCNSSRKEANMGLDELLLLVRFVQMLLSDSCLQKSDSLETGIHLLRRLKADDDSWGHIIEALLVGSGTSSGTVDWLLQELLKDKLQRWFSSKSREKNEQPDQQLSKKEQGIIHMVAGLGFEWALSPILSHGVPIDFRDINGWTALHWAARFGREKMVAALLASGASPGAVTDPSPQDPIGKTPAFIAETSGHKGLAGYLSEVALTSHLSSLTLKESELSKGTAEVEADRTVDNISTGIFASSEEQVSLKDTLAAVRNAAQAAARIQAAFRAHSFRKRQQKEVIASDAKVDEYGISSGDIQALSEFSKLAFRNAHEYNSAALSIQKKYRGWKGRKDFLAFKQNVVKIQALVRGYQVRKHYKVICWAVGILDKVVLRWRRKGAGLRGFRNETECTDESEDEDILKVFRKQKVDGALAEAVSRVLSMVDSPDARQQYHRMLERFRQAKAELGDTSETVGASTSLDNVSDMDDIDLYELLK
ncbi:hypothetical protein Tsubulata_026522 [Turnera subulata]|uniref:CG-1 domain-containing protein n=1 Tax=Turnera subulata TaxID=218843 RepID=A0A9Q0JB05_9ROSI|nr:hypothetical protein Tsubulata_026522 [Turnera subulata]